jgi:indole-3-glycerol phosphate synthase
MTFVRTDTFLDTILANTAQEVAERSTEKPLIDVINASRAAPPPRDMLSALRRDSVALIAEVKHASPSRGVLIAPFDPPALGTTYARNGAAALSVLTDRRFFRGHLNHMAMVREVVNVPVLRKDFVIDPYQVYEGRAAGADAILLIVAALEDGQFVDLYTLTTTLGMAALVEVHNEAELERALRLVPAALLGVNNRDLKTFEVDLNTTARLADLVPDSVTLVAESGLHTVEDVRRMGELGAHAVLVGEALVKADDIAGRVRAFSSQPRGDSRGCAS